MAMTDVKNTASEMEKKCFTACNEQTKQTQPEFVFFKSCTSTDSAVLGHK